MLEITCFFVIVLFLAAAARRKYGPGTDPHAHPPRHAYRRVASLLTHTEAQFYRVLVVAVGPLITIQCKVRLADILLAPKGDLTALRRISQKHVDFLLCQQGTLQPLVAVELDDTSHEREDRRERDRLVDEAYRAAGLPILHVRVQRQYNTAEILEQVQQLL